MSHLTIVKTKMTDISAIKMALTDMGYTFEEGELMVRDWQKRYRKVDLVIKTGSRYEIGLRENKEGIYEIVADWWGIENYTSIKRLPFMRELKRRYAYHKVKEEVERKGFSFAEEEVLEDNTIKLVVRKWA